MSVCHAARIGVPNQGVDQKPPAMNTESIGNHVVDPTRPEMTANAHEPKPLERRPEARAFKVEDLAYEVERGRVRIPSFQRGLRWDSTDAKKLLDSIYRGYPVGTLLFWQTRAEADEVRIGSVRVSGEARSDALWVVDGQQRIASLARVLLGAGPEEETFALFFDLDRAELSLPKKGGALTSDPGRWLPMNRVLDSETLMQWLFEHAAEHKERRDRAIQLGKRIREYEIPAYLVRTDDESILREVFGRINSAGKRLKDDEVFDALHGAYRQASPATLKEVARDLMTLGFGHIEEDKVLYRLLLAIQGQDAVHGAKREFRLPPSDAAAAYQQTEQAARRAIQFIREEAHIPHYELLPYKQPLVALGKFFHHYPQPSARSRELLARWIWRGALSGAHRGDTASSQSTLWQIGRSYSEEESVQALLAQVNATPAGPPPVDVPFKFSAAISKLQTLGLLALHPVNLDDGGRLEPQWLEAGKGGQGDTRLPKILANAAKGLSSSIANRLFHPPMPGLRRRLEATHNEQTLLSHGITPRAIEALRSGNTVDFLKLRAEFLDRHLQHFVASRARWEENDRPALNAFIIDDDEADEESREDRA